MSQKDLDEQEIIEVFTEFAAKYGRKDALQLIRELASESEYIAE